MQESNHREGYVTLSLTPTIFGQKVYKFLQSYADFNYYSLIFSDVFWDLDKLTNT